MAEPGNVGALAAPSVPGYVVGERLGAGGFGEVWGARHELIGRDVAIKVLNAKYSADPEAVARFVAEARAVNKISHPNIVQISDFGLLADGRQYCVMERIRGTTLRDECRVRGRFSLDDALPILRGIAEAVDAAHAAGIAHRDLKPDNVFLVEGGGVKLIDFGLAKLTREDAAPITETGSVFGTPLYMSPEQCRGKAVTLATDAYSFGVLAYQLLTGETPFSGEALELALRHLNDDPTPPSVHVAELGARVDRVVLALMAKDPAQRPTSLVAAIDSIVEGTLPRQPRRRKRFAWLAVAGLVVAGAVLTSIAFASSSTKDDGCTPAAGRLAQVWDGSVRAKLLARFVGRSDVLATGSVLAKNLDEYSGQWARQWNAACHAPDRTSDPLLYAQRMTCLDNAFLALRGYSSAVLSAEVTAFTDGYRGFDRLPTLPDCDTVSVLRAQSPSPPPELRALVGALVVAVQIGRADARTGGNAKQPALLAKGLGELEASAKALEALHVPEAVMAWSWYAELTVFLVSSSQNPVDPLPPDARLRSARETIARARRLGAELRNDIAVANLADSEMQLELRLASLQPGAESEARVAAAFSAAEAAIARAGGPIRERQVLAERRAGFALDKGDLATAEQQLNAEIEARGVNEPTTVPRMRAARDAKLAAAKGDFTALVAYKREVLADELATWGPLHWKSIGARDDLARTLDRAGQKRAARDEMKKVLDALVAIGSPSDVLTEARKQVALMCVQLGDYDLAKEVLEGVPRDNVYVWGAVAFSSFNVGAPDFADWASAQPSSDVPDGELTSNRAYVAFMRGDDRAMRELATKVADKHPTAELLLRYADARQHMTPRPPRLFPPPPELLSFDRGLQSMTQRRWRDASVAFHELTKATRIGVAQRPDVKWSLAEALAFEGHAAVEAGDAKAAIPLLEEAISITDQCCNGFHYYVPMAQLALARALWTTGGDKTRARRLAEQARDNFARVGPFRDPERQQAIDWLASHP